MENTCPQQTVPLRTRGAGLCLLPRGPNHIAGPSRNVTFQLPNFRSIHPYRITFWKGDLAIKIKDIPFPLLEESVPKCLSIIQTGRALRKGCLLQYLRRLTQRSPLALVWSLPGACPLLYSIINSADLLHCALCCSSKFFPRHSHRARSLQESRARASLPRRYHFHEVKGSWACLCSPSESQSALGGFH